MTQKETETARHLHAPSSIHAFRLGGRDRMAAASDALQCRGANDSPQAATCFSLIKFYWHTAPPIHLLLSMAAFTKAELSSCTSD